MTFAEAAARFYKCLASGQQGSNRDLWVMRLHTSGFLTFGIFENERILIAVGYRKENNVPKIREKECFPESALISKSLCSPASLSAADSRLAHQQLSGKAPLNRPVQRVSLWNFPAPADLRGFRPPTSLP